MKRLAILGSTGSIGQNALKVVSAFADRFSVAALAAHTRVDQLAEQVLSFRPEVAVVADGAHADRLRERIGHQHPVEILHGPEGYVAAAALPGVDTVLTAVVGAAGLLPTLAAVDAGKTIALANKETLVMAGEAVMARAREKKVAILPVDSEHSAIFQCLGRQPSPRSGQDSAHRLRRAFSHPVPRGRSGPLRWRMPWPHPNWAMGPKITVDSSTLMNKGLEFIEARHLFDVPARAHRGGDPSPEHRPIPWWLTPTGR